MSGLTNIGLFQPFSSVPRATADVFLQDQHTPVVNWILHQDLETVTLAAPAVIDANTITLLPGHSAAAGQVLNLLEGDRYFQAIVLNVAVNVLTLDNPFDYAFTVGAATTLGNPDLSVNGSLTPVLFHGQAPPNLDWDITSLVVYIVDNAAMDDTTLGGIAGGVANGIVLRARNGVYSNIGNAKTNGNFKAQGCEVVYAEKVGGGEWSMQAVCRFAGQQFAGVTIRLIGADNDEIEAIVQDDLSAITRINAVLIGHVVD